MGGTKGVIFGLGTLWETRDPTKMAQGTHRVFASCQNLVRVGLMTDIPDNTIVGRIVDVMKRHSQLDRAKIGR